MFWNTPGTGMVTSSERLHTLPHEALSPVDCTLNLPSCRWLVRALARFPAKPGDSPRPVAVRFPVAASFGLKRCRTLCENSHSAIEGQVGRPLSRLLENNETTGALVSDESGT